MASELEKVETDVEISASAEKFHEMFVGRPHHVSNATPDKVHGCDLQEGEWGEVGNVTSWTYTHDGDIKTAKVVMDHVDAEKNEVVFNFLEGDLLKEYKTFKATLKVYPKEDGAGSRVHWIFEYERHHDEIAHPETLLEFAVDVSKDIDSHLNADQP